MLKNGSKLKSKSWLTSSFEETIALGIEIGKNADPNALLCLFGDLGSGKTTLIKGIVEGKMGIKSAEVSSPTFVYMCPYMSHENAVYHFDLYRLKGPEEFLSMGFEDYLWASGLKCIEWSERIVSLLPSSMIKITLQICGEGKRSVTIDEKNCI